MYRRSHFFLALFFLISLRAAADPLAFTNLWSLRVGAGIGDASSPALSPDGVLYFGSGDRHFYAISTNRYIKWAFKTGSDIKSSPAIGDDGTIYIGSRDRKFYAVTPEGKLKWSFVTKGWVDSSPAIAPDGTVYFGSWDRTFYALNPNGTKKWAFTTPGEITSSPAIGADGTIYFGSHDKKLYALNPDGSKKWDFATGGQIVSSPAIDFSGNIYFSSVDGKFYALNPNGTLRWSTQTGGTTESSPVIADDGTIYTCINNSRSAISPDGKIKWSFPASVPLADATPVLGADGRIFYVAGDGTLTGLRPNGDILWLVWLDSTFKASPLIAPDGTIYVFNWAASLNAEQANTTLMNSAWPMFRANLRHTGVVNQPAR